VKLYLLPDPIKTSKRKTKTARATFHPTYNEMVRYSSYNPCIRTCILYTHMYTVHTHVYCTHTCILYTHMYTVHTHAHTCILYTHICCGAVCSWSTDSLYRKLDWELCKWPCGVPRWQEMNFSELCTSTCVIITSPVRSGHSGTNSPPCTASDPSLDIQCAGTMTPLS